RRRHTRFSRDWSSDVCSSDLPLAYRCFVVSAHRPAPAFFATNAGDRPVCTGRAAPAAGAAPPVARHALCRGFGVWKIAVNALTSRITLDRAARDYTSVRQIRRRVDRLLRFVAERASQHLADIGFRQLGAELDMLRHFVAGQALVAEIAHFL